MKDIQEFKKFEIPLEYKETPRADLVHIGLVLLSTDHSLELDWAKLSANKAAIFTTRVYYSSQMTPEALDDISSNIASAQELIAYGLDMDVMAFGCTSASIIIGEDKVSSLLTKNRANIPATNPWTAAKAAFKYLDVKKISVFSPYPTSVNFALYNNLTNAGFEVVALGSLGIQNDTKITNVSKESMLNGLEKMLKNKKTDAVFMSCTNLRVLDHIEEIERRFSLPVICSNQAMFWHCMNLLSKEVKCSGYGHLLSL